MSDRAPSMADLAWASGDANRSAIERLERRVKALEDRMAAWESARPAVVVLPDRPLEP